MKMKNNLLLLFLFISLIGFSQSPKELIQNYLGASRAENGLASSDIEDWIIESETTSSATGISNYYVKQRYQGIEIFRAVSNFWIKKGQVLNGGKEFLRNISQKTNTTNPALSVTDGLTKVFAELKLPEPKIQVLESLPNHHFKLSNGNLTEDPIVAKLVYHVTNEDQLRLAWDCTFYTQDYAHLWSIRIDAVEGIILEKNDLVLSCDFESKSASFEQQLTNLDIFNVSFAKEIPSLLAARASVPSYKVIPYNYESPNHIDRQLITNPANGVASPKGWHDANSFTGNTSSLIYTTTRGNNVWAKDDFYGTNSVSGSMPDGGPSLLFDFPYEGNGVEAASYIDAANTNLFYMNNIMHDIWYHYGFDESSGNFQTNNYAKGGFQGDAVFADAQDGSMAANPSLNNANFSTPPDGTGGRMQMFLWNYKKPSYVQVNSPTTVAGNYNYYDNVFSPGHVDLPVAPDAITSDLVLFDDGTSDNSDACSAAINSVALNGKIAVIRRGVCNFINKVKEAQNAGAIAVVIVNNTAGVFYMTGADDTVTIPAIGMSQSNGEALIAAMASETVNVTLTIPEIFVNADGDFDNGIIAHEYGHGISTRLAGGAANSNCLQSSEQQGEGWSDFFALMLQLKPGDTRDDAKGLGTFTANQLTTAVGIRTYKYSPNRAINPFTFASTNSMWYKDTSGIDKVHVHAVGSVWCTILWDLAWNYMDKYGFDSNIYTGTGGNNKVMRLVLDAIKLQPCNPSFIDARDAILAADQATTGGENYCMIWATFAKRGLGANASSGTNIGVAGIKDQVEDFTEPTPGPNCNLAVDYFENSEMITVFPNPSQGLITIRIPQFNGKLNLQVFDVNGRAVYTINNDSFAIEKTINLGHLQSGIYLLKINNDLINYSQKIILH